MEPEVAGLIDFSSLDLGGIEPVDLDIQNAYSSWLSEGNTGSLSDFQAATSETTPTDLTDMGAGSDTDAATIAPPGLLASVLDPKPMIGLATPKVDAPAAPTFNISERGRDLAIRTMIGEAASEPDEGMAGVGAVTINRLKSGRWGDDLEKVVLAPNQFEPWSTRKDELLAIKPDDPQYQRAASIFDKVAKGEMPDPTKGALNFANPEIVAARGNTSALGWIDKMKTNGTGVQIGRHLFGNPDVAAGETAAPRPPGLVPFFKPQTIPVREGVDFAGIKPSVRGLYDRLSKAGIDGLEVVSGYRDPARNARVGGASGSRHIEGDALDFNIEKLSDAQRQKLIDEAVAGGARGIGIYPGGRSVHIDMRETPTAWGANPDAPYSGVADPKAYPAWAQPGLQRLFGGEAVPRVQAAAFAPEERSRPSAPSYEDRMASIGAQRIPEDGFIPVQPGDLPAVPDATGMRFNDQPGLLGGLLEPNPTNRADGQSRMPTLPGAVDPRYLYENPAGTALPRAPEPTARDMVAGARTGGARPASIASDNRATMPAVRSATTGGRPVNPVMQEDLSNAPDGGARQFAAMEASRGGPFSMFGGGQEAPQAATGGVAPAVAGDVPAAGSAPVQSAPGSATAAPASGGWKMPDTMSDFFLALGSSLLSSPKGQPLAGFGKAFTALQIASQETNKTREQQSVLASEIYKGTGGRIPMDEALRLSINPQAAKMAVDRVQTGIVAAKRGEFNATLPPLDADTPAPSVAVPAPTPAAPAQAAQPAAEPTAPSAAQPTQSPSQSPAAAPNTEARRRNLEDLRRRYSASYGLAPDEQSRAAVKARIEQVDYDLKQLGDPLDKRAKELAVIKAERDLAGEGAVPISQEERASLGIGPGQAAYRTRSGEIKFGPAGTKIEMPGQEREFDKEAGKAVAKRFEAMATEGDAARQDRALIGQLRSLGGKIGNMGAGAALQGRLAEWGVKVGDNVSEIEAYNAIVDKLTPQQRVPGTGASSDKDIGLFKSSLPSLVRTPEGNALVVDTLDAVAADKEARAAIAEKALFKEITPAQAVESLRALPDPLARFKEMQAKGAKNGGGAGSTVRPDGSSPPTPSTAPDRAAVEAELRRRQLLK